MPPVPITSIQTPQQIQKAAESQVDAEISGAVAPLQGQVGTLQSREQATMKAISDMFGSILPHSGQAAQNVGRAYDNALAQEGAIFNAAQNRLNELRQTRAQEAQSLAQKMGGPVSVGDFTDAVDPAIGSLAALGAGSMLHTLGYAQAGVQEAEAWHGKVLPLVQTEETARARGKFQEDIKELENQIANLKSQRTSKVNAKAVEMQIREREFALQKKQTELEALKANRDWQATLRTLKNDERRIDMAQKEFDLRRGEALGEIDGQPTLQAKQLTAQQKQQAAALGMSEKEYQLRLKELNQQSKLASQQLAAAQRSTWAQYLDAAVNPQPGKKITVSRAVPVDANLARIGKGPGAHAYPDASSPTGFSRIVKTEQNAVTEAILNPNQLVDYLVAHNVPKKIAINMVKKRLGLSNSWTPGTDPTTGTGPSKADKKK